ncbi:hypothetical protein, partial [Sporomusa malonica]
ALLYIVQFSGNDVHGCTSVTDVSWMIRFVRDRVCSPLVIMAEYHNSIFRLSMSILLFMLIISAAVGDFYRLSHSCYYVKLIFFVLLESITFRLDKGNIGFRFRKGSAQAVFSLFFTADVGIIPYARY